MLPAAHRMRRSGDFDRTVRKGVRTGKSTMVFHLVESDDDAKVPLVGFVVSKAVGNAVVRNRVKRRMRAIVASHLAEVPTDARIVLRSLPGAASTDFAQLDADFVSCLRRGLRRQDERGSSQ